VLCASIPESPVMKLSDHPLPVKKISSENVFYWWSHQVFRNQWNQKSDDRSKFSTPIQLRLYRGSNSPRKCSPDVVAYSEKTHSSKKFFTPLATFAGACSAIPCPIFIRCLVMICDLDDDIYLPYRTWKGYVGCFMQMPLLSIVRNIIVLRSNRPSIPFRSVC